MNQVYIKSHIGGLSLKFKSNPYVKHSTELFIPYHAIQMNQTKLYADDSPFKCHLFSKRVIIIATYVDTY